MTEQTRGAERLERYSAIQKGDVILELCELQDKEQEIWRVHGTTPQLFLARKTGIPNSNISKWQLDDDTIIKNVSEHVVQHFSKISRPRRWFGNAGKNIYSLVLARCKRKLRVSSFWIRLTCQKVARGMFPDDPRAKQLYASARLRKKVAKHPEISMRE